MSSDICFRCGEIVKTTCSPNDVEGWFISEDKSERLEAELDPRVSFWFRGLMKTYGAVPMVICETCQKNPAEFEVVNPNLPATTEENYNALRGVVLDELMVSIFNGGNSDHVVEYARQVRAYADRIIELAEAE